jgi:hypothetical protein
MFTRAARPSVMADTCMKRLGTRCEMATVTAGLRLIYRCIVTVVSLAIIYAIFEVLRQGEPNPTARALLVGVGVLAFALAAAAWSRHTVAMYVQVCAIPILAALYLFELQHRDPIDEYSEQHWRLARAKAASGQPFTVQISPTNFIRTPHGGIDLPSGEIILPLGQVADLPTIMCREGARPFAEFEADERGFNNPKGIWGKPVDIMFIGDSMTYGACLPNRDHFIAQIRERFPSTLNLGAGGLGPLIELAQIREFVPKIKPKYIFYMYDENNDLYSISPQDVPDIVVEYGNPILRKYLVDDQFSQHIYERQPEINAALKQFADLWIASALAEHTPLKSLLRVLGLPSTRASLPSPLPSIKPAAPTPNAHRVDLDKRHSEAEIETVGHGIASVADAVGANPDVDYFELFKETFSKMVQVSKEAGAKFVFVNIPAHQSICDGIDHPWKRRVLDFARKSGVDFIDLERDFRNADKTIGRDALFTAPPCGGHFSERGYKIIGDRLLQYLEIQKLLANSDGPVGIMPEYLEIQELRANSDGPLGIFPDGWRLLTTARVGRDAPTTTPQVVWSETQVYQPYVKFSAVLAAGSDVPTRAEGASILGLPYKRHNNGNGLRVTVKFTAYSLQDNEIVAALFVGQESKSVHYSTQPVRAGSSASVMLTYDVDRLSDTPINFEVRVGSRRPGELYINGDDTGAVTSDLKTSLTIEELWQPSSLVPGSLVYVGAALSESDRRMRAARMREPSAGVLARTYEDAKEWVIRRIATTRDFHHEQTYQSYVRINRVVSADAALDTEGSTIMSYSWKPKSPAHLVRMKVDVPAWSGQPNSIVVALFVNQSVVANKVVSQELAPRKVAAAVLEFEMAAASTEPIGLHVRVGPGQPGVIYLNGNENGAGPDMPTPKLTIEEYRPFWRLL